MEFLFSEIWKISYFECPVYPGLRDQNLLGLDKLDIPDVQSQLKEPRARFRGFKKNTACFKDIQTKTHPDRTPHF